MLLHPRTILFAIGALISAQAIATEGFITLNGRVSELNLIDSSEKNLAELPIEIWQGDSLLMTLKTSEKGKYSIQLPFYHFYTVKYGCAPYIRKMIEVDATDFSQYSQKRGYTISLDITLFSKEQCKGFEFLETTPIARASYNKEKDNVVWNAQHIYNIHERIGEAVIGCLKQK